MLGKDYPVGTALPKGFAVPSIGEIVNAGLYIQNHTHMFRRRFTIAEINAGVAWLPAIPGWRYRMVAASAIAFGGAVGATTTVDITATLSGSSRKLVAFAQASLTQSTKLTDGISGAAILADGASYSQNDANTGIGVSKTGASLTVATGVEIAFLFTLDPA